MLQWSSIKQQSPTSNAPGQPAGLSFQTREKNTRSLQCFQWSSSCPHAIRAGFIKDRDSTTPPRSLLPCSHSLGALCSLSKEK